jgi:hypothetical protein
MSTRLLIYIVVMAFAGLLLEVKKAFFEKHPYVSTILFVLLVIWGIYASKDFGKETQQKESS